MHVTHILTLKLGRISRTNEPEFWQYVDHVDMQAWDRARNILEKRRYTHSGCEVTVEVDWTSAYADIKTKAALNEEYHNLRSTGGDLTNFFNNYPTNANLTAISKITISGNNEFSDYDWYPAFFLEKYLYDFFCMMNLSTPGSCDFLNIKISSDKNNDSDKLHLSSYNLEEALNRTMLGHGPAVKVIDLERVRDWYDKLNLDTKQKSDTPIEKTLFSLMHLCRIDGDISSILWIFHALESIYSTKVGESFSNLINRISSLLNLTKNETTKLKKRLRSLYDHRSSMIHGGYKVHHPMGYETIDPRLDDDISKNYELNQLGIALIISSIQALISNNWYGLKVTESLHGNLNPAQE